jgi:SAM-dependent methyltransferase
VTNDFSPTWFSTFLDEIPAERTASEVAFLQRWLPLPDFERVIDLCSGSGRIAIPLARSGYDVLGVDSNAAALDKGRRAATVPVEFRQMDMRDIDALGTTFDAVVCLWHSFGYGTDAENLEQLSAMARRLRPGGRLIMDVYNADALRLFAAEDVVVRGDRRIETKREWRGNRLNVSLSYGDGGADEFEWRLYTPKEFLALAEQARLRPLLMCAWNDEKIPPSADHARMQFVFERP